MHNKHHFRFGSWESRLIRFNAEALSLEPESQPEEKTDREQVMKDVQDFLSRTQALYRATLGDRHDGYRLFRSFYNVRGGGNRDNYFEYSRACERLQKIDPLVSTKEIRDRLEIARKSYQQVEQGMRKLVIEKAEELGKFLGGAEWKQLVEQFLKAGVDREHIDAVVRAQALFARRVADPMAPTDELCDRHSVVLARIDRAHWELANRNDYAGRLRTLRGANERVVISAGLQVRRGNEGRMILAVDRTVWSALVGGGGEWYGRELPLHPDTVQGVSTLPSGDSWMLWNADGRSIGFIGVSRPSDAERKQGYGLRITIVENTNMYSYLARFAE